MKLQDMKTGAKEYFLTATQKPFHLASHAGPLGVQHLDEQVVAGHLPAQVHVAQVVLGLRAQRAQLRQPHHQLAELLLELRVGGQAVLQQGAVHLLLHAVHERLVLQQLHVCRGVEPEMSSPKSKFTPIFNICWSRGNRACWVKP